MGVFITGSDAVGKVIQLVLAPVVMVSACAITVGGILSRYQAINDRLRNLNRERLDLLRVRNTADIYTQERITIIDQQYPDLLERLRTIHNAAVALYSAMAIFLVDMLVIAVVALNPAASWAAVVAISVFLVAIATMSLGLIWMVQEVSNSLRSVTYEVEQIWHFRDSMEAQDAAQQAPPQTNGATIARRLVPRRMGTDLRDKIRSKSVAVTKR